MSIALTLSQAIVGLEEGHVIWCQPPEYNGWWVALGRNRSLYEYSCGNWYRCKKGVSTILGADWYLRDPADTRHQEPPAFTHAHYESEASIARELRQRKGGGLGPLEQIAIEKLIEDYRILVDELRGQLVDIGGQMGALRDAVRQLGDNLVSSSKPGPPDG